VLTSYEVGRCDVAFNPNKEVDPRTEWQIQDDVSALRLWDCGKIKWSLKGEA